MAKSGKDEIKAGIANLSPNQQNKLMGDAPANEAAGKNLTDKDVKADLIENAYDADESDLPFDEWVQMKLPELDKDS